MSGVWGKEWSKYEVRALWVGSGYPHKTHPLSISTANCLPRQRNSLANLDTERSTDSPKYPFYKYKAISPTVCY